MADSVQHTMEMMIPELEDLQDKEIFNKDEIRSIVKRRRDFEYALRSKKPRKIDTLRYVTYELNLESLRSKRKVKLGLEKMSLSDHTIVRRIHFLFQRALKHFKGDIALWLQYIDFTVRTGGKKILGKLFPRALQLHPTEASLWIEAANWEFTANNNIAAARVLLQRGIRLIPKCAPLWLQFFRLELLYIHKIRTRREVLGLSGRGTAALSVPELPGEENADDSTAAAAAAAAETAVSSGAEKLQTGAVAKVIFDAAVKEFPHDSALLLKFLRTADDLARGPTLTLTQHVLGSITALFPLACDVAAVLARRSLFAAEATMKQQPGSGEAVSNLLSAELAGLQRLEAAAQLSSGGDVGAGVGAALWAEVGRFMMERLQVELQVEVTATNCSSLRQRSLTLARYAFDLFPRATAAASVAISTASTAAAGGTTAAASTATGTGTVCTPDGVGAALSLALPLWCGWSKFTLQFSETLVVGGGGGATAAGAGVGTAAGVTAVPEAHRRCVAGCELVEGVLSTATAATATTTATAVVVVTGGGSGRKQKGKGKTASASVVAVKTVEQSHQQLQQRGYGESALLACSPTAPSSPLLDPAGLKALTELWALRFELSARAEDLIGQQASPCPPPLEEAAAALRSLAAAGGGFDHAFVRVACAPINALLLDRCMVVAGSSPDGAARVQREFEAWADRVAGGGVSAKADTASTSTSGVALALRVREQQLIWAHLTGGLNGAREVYDSLLRRPLHACASARALLLRCIALELANNNNNVSGNGVGVGVATTAAAAAMVPVVDMTRVRRLFDAALELFGEWDVDLWVRYVTVERQHGGGGSGGSGAAGRVASLQWRAEKQLQDPQSFLHAVSLVLM